MSTLEEGANAPDFKGIDQDGNEIQLSDFRGKRIILYFYPKDDTPGCTAQACNLRDNYEHLKSLGFEVIGISTDPVKSHKKFEKKYSLPFTLIADEEKSIVEKYQVWGEKKFMGKTYMGVNRTTFLIDEEQKIKMIINKPNTENQTQQVLDAWSSN